MSLGIYWSIGVGDASRGSTLDLDLYILYPFGLLHY
jgi:hypothetical protein